MATEKHYRSIVKALSWRVTGTIDTMVIAFLITGHVKMAVSIGLVEVVTKVCLYYAHERVWNRISFGRLPENKSYEI
jgi:uncharacterized membrane protein